jgi:hypothetical protein
MYRAVPAMRHFIQHVLIVLLLCAAASSQVAAPSQAAIPPAPSSPQFDNRFFAEFDKLIHVKRVHTGDAVTAHLTVAAKLRDGTELPKGSKLVGRITDLKIKADKEGPSKLGLLFTGVVLKDGKQLPLDVALVAVAPHSQIGEADLLSAGNPFSGGNRMQAGTGANTLNNTSNEGEALSRGLGARAPASKTNVGEAQMLPGKSYLPDVVLLSYSASTPGTILESKSGSVYVDAGCRLLLLMQ